MTVDGRSANSLLAIDVGGTSTRAVIVTTDGDCLGFGVGAAGNPTSSGPDAAAAAISTAARGAMQQAGVDVSDLTLAVAAIAGAGGTPGVALREGLRAEGLTMPLVYRADLLGMYGSGALDRNGYAMVAGTGSVGARIVDGDFSAVSDGLGWLVGDDGSGYWIGHRAARAVIGALDGRAPSTAITNALLAQIGVTERGATTRFGRSQTVHETIDLLYQLKPVRLAEFAPLVFDAALAGDQVAAEIVDGAGDALANTLRCVLDASIDGPLVLGGSVLSHQPVIADKVVREFRAAGLTGRVTTVSDGTVGAAVLALREAGIDPDADMFARLQSTSAALRTR